MPPTATQTGSFFCCGRKYTPRLWIKWTTPTRQWIFRLLMYKRAFLLLLHFWAVDNFVTLPLEPKLT